MFLLRHTPYIYNLCPGCRFNSHPKVDVSESYNHYTVSSSPFRDLHSKSYKIIYDKPLFVPRRGNFLNLHLASALIGLFTTAISICFAMSTTICLQDQTCPSHFHPLCSLHQRLCRRSRRRPLLVRPAVAEYPPVPCR